MRAHHSARHDERRPPDDVAVPLPHASLEAASPLSGDRLLPNHREHVPVVDDQHEQFGRHGRLLFSLSALVTWNTRGLFSPDVVGQSRKLRILGALCAANPIVCLQECHASPGDWEQLVPKSQCFVSFHRKHVEEWQLYCRMPLWRLVDALPSQRVLHKAPPP